LKKERKGRDESTLSSRFLRLLGDRATDLPPALPFIEHPREDIVNIVSIR